MPIPYTFGTETGAQPGSQFDDNFVYVATTVPTFLSSVSGTNTITGTPDVEPTVYKVGQHFSGFAAATNTGATTLAVGTLGSGAVQQNGAALVGGEIVSGNYFEVVVSATTPVFQIVNGLPIPDGNAIFANAANPTKLLALSLADITSGTTRTITVPDRNISLGLTVVRQIFASSVTYTPTAGMVYADVELQAAGGSGGGCAATVYAGASGGSGGEYCRAVFSAATIGASQTVTIGAAGAVPLAATNGNNASNSNFGALITAHGGLGGSAGLSGSVVQEGVDGGTGSSAQLAIQGGSSGPGFGGNGTIPGAGGQGGDSQLGSGGRALMTTTGNRPGINGKGYGAGGSGAVNGNGAALAGGAGAGAICIVTEYVAG